MRFKTKKLLFPVVLLAYFSVAVQAQVTIGSGLEPNNGSLLQLKETTDNPDGTNASKGLNLSRVKLTDESNLYPMFLADPANPASGPSDIYKTKKNSIDLEHRGLVVYNVVASSRFPVGIYSWNGQTWVYAGGTSSWHVSGTGQPATQNTQDIYQMGSVSVGTDQTDPTAILNIQSANKGVLLPKVALKSPTDQETITNPTPGLLVYNTGAEPAFSIVGYLFWDGMAWKRFAYSPAEAGSATLNCAGATMTPNQQITYNTPIIAGSILQIPYTGSNGGSYNGATLTSTGNPGVTATLSGGMLSAGNGVLNFALHGTPALGQESPNGITFNLDPFLNANPGITGCNEVVVGNITHASISELAVMGNLMLLHANTGNDNTTYYALQCNSPDGKFSVRVGVPSGITNIAHGNQFLNVQIRNNSNVTVPVIWNFNTDYAWALSTSGVLPIPPQKWGGDNDSGGTWHDATNNDSDAGIASYWGQVGIYDSENSGPEYRRYTWIPQGENNKVAYEIKVMVALDTTTPGTAVHPTKVKCYIKMEQTTAY
jgi:hypothetical protein